MKKLKKIQIKTKPEIAIDNMVRNGGFVEPAVIEAGYSEAYAKSGKFQKTKQFRELVEDYLPDDFLLKALSDDIENKPINRKAELELAFKIKGKLIEKQEIKAEITDTTLSDTEKEALRKLIK